MVVSLVGWTCWTFHSLQGSRLFCHIKLSATPWLIMASCAVSLLSFVNWSCGAPLQVAPSHICRRSCQSPGRVILLTRQWIIPWIRIRLEKLIVAHLVTYSASDGSWTSITMLTRASHRLLSFSRWIQPTPSYTVYFRLVSVVSFYLNCLGDVMVSALTIGPKVR